MVLFYAIAGINHFVHPGLYMKIMPPWLPWHSELVWLSGVAEIVCALLLLIPATRRIGAYCTITLLIAIFPANIQMLIDYKRDGNPLLWIAVLRLPLQLLLIWWAYHFTKPMKVKNLP